MFKKMTLRKKIALMLTLCVLLIGIGIWGFIYRNERIEVIEENRRPFPDTLTLCGRRADGLKGIRISSLSGKIYPRGRLT